MPREYRGWDRYPATALAFGRRALPGAALPGADLNTTPIPRAVILAIHDIAPAALDACRRLAAWLDATGLGPLSLLVVPAFHGDRPIDPASEAARWLRARVARGDEVVLHGYRHLADRPPARLADRLRAWLLTAGEGEFQALPRAEAAQRLAAGLATLAAAGLGRPRGFVAPAWLLGEEARQAVAALGFAYTTSRTALHDLAAGRSYPAPALGLSSRSRARLAVSRAVVPWLWRAARRAPLIRFALHPVDVCTPAALALLERMLREALARRRVLTYGAALDAMSRASELAEGMAQAGVVPPSPVSGSEDSSGSGWPGIA